MNGRVYDPELGRFMSADPFVQAPHNTQSYNRYSYVFNNPLSFTDPNGYQARTVEDIHVPGKDTREDQRRQREQEREDGNRYAAEEMARQYIEQMIAYSMSEWTFSTPDGIVRISITDPVKAVAGISGGEHAQKASGPAGAGTEADRVAFQKELDALTTDGSLSKYRSFDNADAAATEVLDLTAPLSKKYGLEVGGNIWQDKKGWHYTIPIIGGPGSVDVPGSHIGYHTHPYGSMKFSNQFNSYTGGPGDAGWVASSGKSLYMGVVINGSVSIGVCDPGSCSQFGRLGTSPSRVLK
mgnify:CR=1 FL=1